MALHFLHISIYSLFFAALLLVSSNGYTENSRQQIPTWNYKLLKTAPHQQDSFTQGLIKQGDSFYESSGLYGRSFIRHYQETNNEEVSITYLPQKYFAEGLTLLNGFLYLLTWKEQTLFKLTPETLEINAQLSYSGQGWGLTHNGTELIMSDGSSAIQFRSPEDFSLLRKQNIHGLDRINELEYANELLWANRWHDDAIYAINNDGCIVGKINLSALRLDAVSPNSKNVLNGIAYDRNYKALWVTGKFWPKRYLIQPDIPKRHQEC